MYLPKKSGSENSITDRKNSEYLAQLLNDKKALLALPNVFQHLDKILDEEINRVRGSLFSVSSNKDVLNLPEAEGPVVTLTEKLLVPISTYPDFNFVGRILGPRGMTAKQLEQDTGCKILVRGKGSMRDKTKEEHNRDKPNWEHLKEDLHVLLTVEDTENRAKVKLARAVEEVKKLLVPAADGEDDLKKLQLMELAIINGTYRENSVPVLTSQQGSRIIATPISVSHQMLSAQLSTGAPIILTPRPPTQPLTVAASQVTDGRCTILQPNQHTLVSPTDSSGIFYQYPFLQPTVIDYGAYDAGSGGKIQLRRSLTVREHPYSRSGLL